MDARHNPPTRRVYAPAWCDADTLDDYSTAPYVPSYIEDLAELCEGPDMENS